MSIQNLLIIMRIHRLATTFFFSTLTLLPFSCLAASADKLPDFIDNINETSLSNPAYVTGQYWFRKIHGSNGFINYPPAYDYLRSQLSKLLPVTSLNNKRVEIGLLNSEQSNAFVLPGNHLFLYTEILTTIDTETKLLALLAHELAHLDLRHYERRLENYNNEGDKTLLLLGTGIAAALAGVDTEATSALWISAIANQQENLLSNSRQQEQEADRQARIYLTKAGIDPQAMTELFLAFLQKSIGSSKLEFLSTHPIADSRYADSLEGKDSQSSNLEKSDILFDEFRATLLAYRATLDSSESNSALSELQDTGQMHYAQALTAYLQKKLTVAQKYLSELDETSNSHAYLKANILMDLGKKEEAIQLVNRKLAVNPDSLMFLRLKQYFIKTKYFNYLDPALLQYERNMLLDMNVDFARSNDNTTLLLVYQGLQNFFRGKNQAAKVAIERAKKRVNEQDNKEVLAIESWVKNILDAEKLYDINPE